ncbi:hypothetical protein [Oricola cellulosilytica]|uniref:Glycosyltransferase RgtA/B/C/D-like domain-containing protein n=1 Tax=Oricola cellulosilytica TaxID=1429082 RepID=A0A4V2MP26_9HYPH|nr:hypothetical protein [Oricola cellulosilytica]TCD16012.1 hypothetical protein E0D97_00785 [Oricola cellulosilytica]
MDGPLPAPAIDTLNSRVGTSVSGLHAGSVVISTVILAVSAWHMFTSGTHADVSWLLTVGERIMAGERLYVDVVENNPPLSVFLYLPFGWLGSVTPVLAEHWTVMGTYVWTIGFGTVALLMSERLGLTTSRERWILVPAGLYVLTLLMPPTFSQREHFGVASALPLLVLAACRMDLKNDLRPRLVWSAVAGVGAAITMMFKPHYALVFLFPYLLAAGTARSVRVLFTPEILIAAIATVLHGVSLWRLYPEYFSQIVPLMLDVYLFRHSLVTLVLVMNWIQLVLGVVLAALMMSVAPRRENPLVWALAAGAFGFYCTFLIIGKGWNYHVMPALSLTAMAIAVAGARWILREWASLSIGPPLLTLVMAASVVFSLTILTWNRFEPPHALVARLRAIAPNPVVASVSGHIGAGFPLVRMLRGTWLERTCSDWIVAWGYTTLLRDASVDAARRARIEDRTAASLAYKIRMWTATPPDIVVLDPEPTASTNPLTDNPEFASILAGYTVVHAEFWGRVALKEELVSAWEGGSVMASSPGAASD